MTNLKNLDKAIKVYENIKILDKHILTLEVYAKNIEQFKTDGTVTLLFTKEKEKKVKMTEDGMIDEGASFMEMINTHYGMMPVFRGLTPECYGSRKKQTFDEYSLKSNCSDSSMLRIISVLHGEATLERLRLLEELKKLGVVI